MAMTCNMKNISSSTISTVTLFVVVVYEGVFNMFNGSCTHQVGILSDRNILESSQNPAIKFRQVEDVYGGSWFSDIGDFFKRGYDKVKSVVENVAPYVSKGVEFAQKARSLLGKGVLVGGNKKSKLRRRMKGSGFNSDSDDEKVKSDSECSDSEIEEKVTQLKIKRLNKKGGKLLNRSALKERLCSE